MDTIAFLEKLATNAHHQVNLDNLISMLPIEFKNAYLMNDAESLKMQISDIDYLANESFVVQI